MAGRSRKLLLYLCTLGVCLLFACERNKKSLEELEKEAFGVIESKSLTVTGIPLGSSSVVDLNITVRDTNGLGYFYKVGPSSLIDCSDRINYRFQEAGIAITENISSYPDGGIRLCVAPKQADGIGLADAVQGDWIKATDTTGFNSELNLLSKDQSMELSWDGGDTQQSFLVVYDITPILWKPQDKQSYAKGQSFEGAKVAYVGEESEATILELENNQAYYFAIYTFSTGLQYRIVAEAAGIVSKNKHAWIKRREGTLYERAYAAGHLNDGNTLTYLCRALVDSKYIFGQLFPGDNESLHTGICWLNNYDPGYAYREKEAFEVLAIAAGYNAADIFFWKPQNDNLFLAGTFDGYNAQGELKKDIEAYFCRFPYEQSKELGTGVYSRELGKCNAYSPSLEKFLASGQADRIEYLASP